MTKITVQYSLTDLRCSLYDEQDENTKYVLKFLN